MFVSSLAICMAFIPFPWCISLLGVTLLCQIAVESADKLANSNRECGQTCLISNPGDKASLSPVNMLSIS